MQSACKILELPAYGESFHRDFNCPCTLPQIVHQRLTIALPGKDNDSVGSGETCFHLGLNPFRPCIALRFAHRVESAFIGSQYLMRRNQSVFR